MSGKVADGEPEHGGQTDLDTKQPVMAWEPVVLAQAKATQSVQIDSVSKPEEHRRRSGLFSFSDPDEIKAKVRASLLKAEPYSVTQYYKTEGIWQKIARHSLFENITLGVIALNAVYIAVDTDYNKQEILTSAGTLSLTESAWYFQFFEHAFCIYFSFEWVVRFMAFKRKLDGLKDAWFVFDSLLVIMMVTETWLLLIIMAAMGSGGDNPMGQASMLRLLRLLRLSRLIRMLKSLPELMILVKGMVTAMKSVVYVMCLLLILTYVFAIAFTQLAADLPTVGEEFFSSVAHSMYSLVIYATFFDDLSRFTDAILEELWPLLILTFLFVCLAGLTVMNMLIGVLCEMVSAVAQKEREEIQTIGVLDKMQCIANTLDKNYNGKISYKEFTLIMELPEALKALEEVGVNPLSIVDFSQHFFFEDGAPVELTFDKFMEMVLDLRESNTATLKDVLNLWMQIKTSTNYLVAELQAQVDELRKRAEEKLAAVDSAGERIESQLELLMEEVRKVTGQSSAGP